MPNFLPFFRSTLGGGGLMGELHPSRMKIGLEGEKLEKWENIGKRARKIRFLRGM